MTARKSHLLSFRRTKGRDNPIRQKNHRERNRVRATSIPFDTQSTCRPLGSQNRFYSNSYGSAFTVNFSLRAFIEALKTATISLLTKLIKETKDGLLYTRTTIKIAEYLVVKIPVSKINNPYFIKAGFDIAERVSATWISVDEFFKGIESFLDTKNKYARFNSGDATWTIHYENEKFIRIDLVTPFSGSHEDITNARLLYEAIQKYKDVIRNDNNIGEFNG